MHIKSNGNLPGSKKPLVLIFTASIFLSAALLFFVQPLFAKLVLPRLGGSPAVWTTAMLFFQTVLIAGYVYAHLTTKYLPPKFQATVHLCLWCAALLFVPLSVAKDWSFDAQGSITLQTLTVFAVGVGMPFAFLSANAPLIQSWYSKSGGPNADDPYFLYGASNLGSLGALLAFPLIVEPLWGATGIGYGWAIGFVALGLLLGICGVLTARQTQSSNVLETSEQSDLAPPNATDYLWWLVLAFIPSSLMLSVTSYISFDLGSFPLLWVIPLSIYLMTFVLTFTSKNYFDAGNLTRRATVSIALMAFAATARHTHFFTIALLFLFFTVISLYSHRALYSKRPSNQYLTVFYVVMSIGGALGGVFNSLIAPLLFSGHYELKVTILIATVLFFVGTKKVTGSQNLRQGIIAAFGLVLIYLIYFLISQLTALDFSRYVIFFIYLFTFLCFLKNPVATAATTSAFIIAASFVGDEEVLYKDRSFFGIHKVANEGSIRIYLNGTTLHGKQLIDELTSERPTPATYYHQKGTFGQVLTSNTIKEFRDIGIVGLGIGSVSCYAQPDQNWHFYEIDEAVLEIAKEENLFSFMSQCGKDMPVHLGDARIVLEKQADIQFDLLVVDAFSSDAVPLHLLTREAIQLYFNRLRPDGILFIHTSNRYFDLNAPLGRVADDLGLQARSQLHFDDPVEDPLNLNDNTRSVILARNADALAEFDENGKWSELKSDGKPVWTDDYANIFSAIKW